MSTQPPLDRRSDHRRTALLWSTGAILSTLAVGPAFASGTRAGSLINNTATASFDNAGTPITVTSNTVSLRVDEVIDAAVAARDSGDAAIGTDTTGNIRSFTVTNAGNAAESFRLSAVGTVSGNQFDPVVTRIAVDTNGNGVYDEGSDQIVADNAASPEIDADATLTVFVISSAGTAADGQHGAVQLTATAATGTGPAGTVFAAQGIGGGDAIVGATTGRSQAQSGFVIAQATVRIDKTAIVADPYGGSRIVPGSVVTYRLAALVQGSGALANVRIADIIPTGTSYVLGSLVQDGAALTDATDADAGVGGSAGIEANLGTVAAGALRVTQFKVRIN